MHEIKRWTLAGFAEDGRVQRMQITLDDLRTEGGILYFGRDPNRCSLIVSDRTVSAVHGKFRSRNGFLEVSDADSTNGTWVNHHAIPPHTWTRLNDGDQLLIGGTELRVFLDPIRPGSTKIPSPGDR